MYCHMTMLRCVLIGPPAVLHATHLLVFRLPRAGPAALCSVILVLRRCHRRSATSPESGQLE